jgi:hypothetical protein
MLFIGLLNFTNFDRRMAVSNTIEAVPTVMMKALQGAWRLLLKVATGKSRQRVREAKMHCGKRT